MSEPPFTVAPMLRDHFDPVEELTAFREADPVTPIQIPFGPTAWLVTGYSEVKSVLGDAAGFSNEFSKLGGTGLFSGASDPGGLGFRDPPEHTRLRKLLTPEFTARKIAALVPRIEQIVADRLDAMEAAGRGCDLVELFAMPIPSLVICELLGIPYAVRTDFMDLTADRFDLNGGADASLGAITASLEFLTKVVQDQRANPGDGLLGMLLREHGDEVTDLELAGLADGILTGGHDTTASMLGMGTLLLLENPRHLIAIRDHEDHVAMVVEEMLRYLSVVQLAFPRFARQDLVIGDKKVAEGEMVLCSLSAANRDGRQGTMMESFDPDREIDASHLAFGHGMHLCVGAQLARVELRIAYPALLHRFPDLALAVPFEDIAFREFSLVAGIEKLPVTW